MHTIAKRYLAFVIHIVALHEDIGDLTLQGVILLCSGFTVSHIYGCSINRSLQVATSECILP